MLNTSLTSTQRWLRICFATVCPILVFHHTASFAAAVFDPDTQPPRTIAPFVLKNTNLAEGATKAYRPWFESGAWQGDLIEYNVTTIGVHSTNVDVGANPPSAPGSNWSARATFADKEASVTDYWDTQRKIITSTTGSDQFAFRWDNLTDSQKLDLDPLADVTDTQNSILDFIRGDRSLEGTGIRVRYSILGDIIDTAPRYVGAPAANFTLAGYAAFASSNASRDGRIVVSANDGMIHVFDEADGSEVFAYIPSMLIPKLRRLTQILYSHRYFADGELVAADAKIGADWKTILAAGLGPGAKGLFALDITNPDLTSETANTGTDKKVLFEKNDSDPDLGHVYGRPSVVLLPDGEWYVASGNGYGSSSGTASLYLVKLSDPNTVIKKSPATITSNGLSAPAFLDTNNDFIADFAYAGDLQGNLWKFEFSTDGSGDLVISSTKLFAAGADQPITVSPDIGAHTSNGYLVYFGTGSLLSASDLGNGDQQSVYGIWDQNVLVDTQCHDGTSGDLLCQTLTETTHPDPTPDGTKVRTATSEQPDWSIHKGWKVNLPTAGERLLGHPQLRGGRLQFISTNPTIANTISWLYQLNFLTGGNSGEVQFDLNEDGSLNSLDKVDVSGTPKIPVAINLGEGNLSQPAIAFASNGTDTLFINGLLLDLGAACSGSCPGGIGGGHIDLDTDTQADGLAGATFGHTHQYDDLFDVTFADYFNLFDSGDQALVTDAGVTITGSIDATNQKLVAILANADLSPGGTLTIGDRSWNVVEYQKMIQQKLATWDGVSEADFVDDNGLPLAFTLDEINGAIGGTGTLKISFDDQAILRGGLIPTSTACVQADPIGSLPGSMPNGHWRGGALTLHLLDFDSVQENIEDNEAPGARVYVLQNATDLPDSISLPTGTIQLKEDTDSDGSFDVFYGGIIANPADTSGFLYESTIFWHYNGACYGTSDWETDKNNSLLTDAKINDLETSEAQLLSDIFTHQCTSFAGGRCADATYTDLLSQLETALESIFPGYKGDIAELAVFIAEGGLGDIHAEKNWTPTIPDEIDHNRATPGPGLRFTVGRQSWLHIGLDAL